MGSPLDSISSRAFSARPLLNRFLGLRSTPGYNPVAPSALKIIRFVKLVLRELRPGSDGASAYYATLANRRLDEQILTCLILFHRPSRGVGSFVG
jgi:hypothetical protein